MENLYYSSSCELFFGITNSAHLLEPGHSEMDFVLHSSDPEPDRHDFAVSISRNDSHENTSWLI